MKRIFTLIALFSITSLGAFAQLTLSVTKSPSLLTSEPLGGESVNWDAPDPFKVRNPVDLVYQSTVPSFPLNGDYSDWLFSNGFGFTIPLTATIDLIEVKIVRKARGVGIRDNRLQLTKAGSLVGADYANTSNNWPGTNQLATYDGNFGLDPLWSETWTPAEINDPSFGFGLVVFKAGGLLSADFADIDRIQITITYTTLFPIVLTNFEVKNVDNKVGISFTTESETKVKTLFIERSSDGKNYTDLFAIQPKGGENIKTTYNLTDAAPLLGTNYYRLKEIDIDGKWHYYETRVVKTTNVSNKFQAYQNSGNVIVNFNNQPGNYTLSMIDMNGAIVATQKFRVEKQAVQLTMNPPVKRTGIYMINLKGGENYNETLKLFIQR